jgi:hypothetical protein
VNLQTKGKERFVKKKIKINKKWYKKMEDFINKNTEERE